LLKVRLSLFKLRTLLINALVKISDLLLKLLRVVLVDGDDGRWNKANEARNEEGCQTLANFQLPGPGYH
jgi:hypothetical protein